VGAFPGGEMEYFFNFNKLGYLKGEKTHECILCLVRDGSDKVERLIVHDTEKFIVSLNLYPYNPGHLLIFPKRHIIDLRQLDSTERDELNSLIDLALNALEKSFTPAGFNIGFNMGLAAGASIAHLHLHIIPRYPREIGIAELIGGKRVLVQNPLETFELLKKSFSGMGKNDEKID
jgi:ATP adenylyltransferase